MFNIPFPTLGGKVFWETLKRKNGWKLQENKVTGHYRVLSPANIRWAWGSDYSEISSKFNAAAASEDCHC